MADPPEIPKTPQQYATSERTCPKCGRMVTGDLDRCPDDATPLVSADVMARVGSRIGEYEITGVIGEDETGVLYSSRRRGKAGPVTLKMLHGHFAGQKDMVEQLAAETRARRPLHHRNVIDVSDLVTTPEGTVFLVMEYLEGESLRSRLRQAQRLAPFEAINILRQAVRGLGTAHAAGIVHGSLQPDNIFLCKREGRRRIVRRSRAKGMRYVVEPEESFDLVKLLDFGMAGVLQPLPGAETRFCGSPRYLSPEQTQGRRPDQRSDIYSLGVVFYEMITGTVPVAGESLQDILRAHALGVVIAPSRRAPGIGIDVSVDALVLKCLQKNPPSRFANAGELRAALDACVTDSAFLREAHRLPGIKESGIDLSEGLPQARQDAARSAEKLVAATVARKRTVKPAPPIPAARLVVPQYVAAPAAERPAAASFPQEPASAPIAEPPPTMPEDQPPEEAPAVDDSAVATSTPQPATVMTADDPAAAVITPPPIAAEADDPAAAVLTPPPVAKVADRPEESAIEGAEPPGMMSPVRPEDISNVDDRPARFDPELDVRPGRPRQERSQRSRVVALLFLLLLGGGIALWSARGGALLTTMKDLVALRSEPVSTTTPLATPSPDAQEAGPPAAVAPAMDLAEGPEPPPAEPVQPEPVLAAPAPPEPEPATPAKMDRATVHASGKHTTSRSPVDRARHVLRSITTTPLPSESEPAPAAESAPVPTTESEPAPAAESEPAPAAEPTSPFEPDPSTTSPAAVKPETAPPAQPNAGDLVREARQRWMRGHYAAAIGKAESALQAEPTTTQTAQAYEIIGLCACAIGDGRAARDATSHLSESKRALVRAACEKKGLTIE